jgi:hypothetical protein
MQWTKRRVEKIVTRLLVTAMLAIIAIGVLVALAVMFHFRMWLGPGIEIVGPLPADLQIPALVYVAGNLSRQPFAG